MFYLTGVGLALFLGVLLLSKREKTIADKILSIWLVVIGFHLALFAFMQLQWYPELRGIDLPMPIIHGPLLYLYTLSLTKGKPGAGWWIHLVPPISFYLYLIPFFLLPVDQKIFVYQHHGIGYESFLAVRDLCIPLSGILYVTLSTLALRTHRKSIVDVYSSTEKVNLLWLQYLILWIGAIWILVFTGNDVLIYGATVLFVFFIGFFGIRQVGIFHPQHEHVAEERVVDAVVMEEKTDTVAEAATRAKYHKSGLTVDLSLMIHDRLVALMNTEKAYREPELSLTDLAARLNTLPNYLSQVINEQEGKNFYDYINTLRIEEFKRLVHLPGSRKLTLFAIAQEGGFNSKSSFNRYFKKSTGQSPSDFAQGFSSSQQ